MSIPFKPAFLAGRTKGLQQSQSRATATAPAVYRPQPLPKVLQTSKNHSAKTKPAIETLSIRRVQPIAVDSRKKTANVSAVSCRPNMECRIQRQTFKSAVVQAVKFYPNLHPGAVEPINSSNIFRLNSFADQYRLHKRDSHGVNVPNQQYNFVRTREGEMLLHNRYRHPSIAEGKQVLYAGEIFFNNGKLEWWSNGSGHYQPYVEDAAQANLPMDQFYSYQQIIKGEHTRKKGR